MNDLSLSDLRVVVYESEHVREWRTATLADLRAVLEDEGAEVWESGDEFGGLAVLEHGRYLVWRIEEVDE